MQPANHIDPLTLVLSPPGEVAPPAPPRRRPWWIAIPVLLILGLVGAEAATSWLQSRVAFRIGQELSWSVGAGPSPRIAFPSHGPYDTRLGYTRLARETRRLLSRGFEVTAQARMSPALLVLEGLGVAPPYPEKASAGLSLVDREQRLLFAARYPRFVWPRFEDVPPLVVATLLFIENRELLSTSSPYANPAVEWDRLVRALTRHALPTDGRTPGASTLATQLEKYRHSPGGRTGSAAEKLRQMTSATLRAYHRGPDTREVRRRIVLDYINTVPLAARPGTGEVIGLGDGLLLWHGADPGEATRLLKAEGADPAQRGRAYAQILSLLLAERRPSHYLLRDRAALDQLVRTYLPLLHRAGVIDAQLLEAALRSSLPQQPPPPPAPANEPAPKVATALRAHLVDLLGLRDVYDLDRLDLSVETTLDARTQREVEGLLGELRDPRRVAELGLRADRLLERGDPANVVYSVLVFERTAQGNALRVQADTLPQPFNVNEGMKLDLGSTAKLRTLVHYLEIVGRVHARYRDRSAEDLRALRPHPRDTITRWVVEQMAAQPGIPLEALLAASLERRFSASPYERFFTGGGLHQFANFDKDDNERRVTLRDAFTHSINLPFVRLMREIVDHLLYGPGGRALALEDDPGGWKRRAYLRRYADADSRARLERYRERHAALAPDERVADVLSRIRPLPQRLAAFHSWVAPRANAAALGRFLDEQLPGHGLSGERIESLRRRYGPEALSFVDRARVMRIDPLELWLIDFMAARPGAGPREEWASSADVRDADWAWIFRTRNERARERRVATMLERDAFVEIHRVWQRLGYPFASLVPSLATAIGASADRPAALAELIGIVLADGMRLPTVRVEQLHFGVGTPYETRLRRASQPGERVMDPAVARAVRQALLEVVSQGTARRAKDLWADAAVPLTVGGKTGTGDSRVKRFARGGRLIASHVMSRSATFAFGIGDRHFGVVTAYVAGPEASRYEFTSALPVQILRLLGPKLEPMLREAHERDNGTWSRRFAPRNTTALPDG